MVFFCFEQLVTGQSRVFTTVAHELGARGYETAVVVPAGSEVARLAARTNAEVLEITAGRLPLPLGRRLRAMLGLRTVDAIFVHSDREHATAASLQVRGASRGLIIRRIGAGSRPPAGARVERAERRATTRYIYTSETPPTGHSAPSGRPTPARAELGVTIPLAPASDFTDDNGGIVLACIATREAVRRATNVLRSASWLTQRHPGLRVRVIGSAAADPDFRVLAGALGLARRVDWIPHPQSFAQALRGASLGWVIADGDDAGLGVLNLMANSIVVMAERSTVASHYVADGIHGILSPILDPTQMAAEASLLMADVRRRRTMGAAGRVRAERDFPLRSMLIGFEQVVRAGSRRTPAGT
ncbi:MAG: glycosyltransferase [Gemmatimonadota bacterium]